MKRKDLLTQEEFVPLRINQKFANAQNRIKYHNKKANSFRHSIAYLSKPIIKDIKILNELMRGEREKVFHKQFLIGKGYNFNVHTHIEDIGDEKLFAIDKYVFYNYPNDYIKIKNYTI